MAPIAIAEGYASNAENHGESGFSSGDFSGDFSIANSVYAICRRGCVFAHDSSVYLLGLNGAAVARVFGQSAQSVYNAKNAPLHELGELHGDPIERDRIGDKLPLLGKWIATLDLKSGILFC